MNSRIGLVTAFVKEVDPKQGRVKVEYSAMEKGLLSPWANVATPLAGKGRGMLFMPEPGDEVLVGFRDGVFDFPCVVGFIWNGQQESSETEASNRVIVTPGGHQLRFEDKKNDTRIVIKSKGEHSLTLEDKASGPRIELKTKAGRELVLDDTTAQGQIRIKSSEHQVTLDDTPGGAKVEIRAGQSAGVTITMNTTPASLQVAVGSACTINIDDSGLSVQLTGQISLTTGGAVSVTTAGALSVSTGGAANVNAGGAVSVNAGGAASITAGGAVSVTAGGAVSVTAAGAASLTCSVASITSSVLNVSSALTNFAGVVMATTVIASNAVISPSYTPGAGNLL